MVCEGRAVSWGLGILSGCFGLKRQRLGPDLQAPSQSASGLALARSALPAFVLVL
jgi:hypothetical protein